MSYTRRELEEAVEVFQGYMPYMKGDAAERSFQVALEVLQEQAAEVPTFLCAENVPEQPVREYGKVARFFDAIIDAQNARRAKKQMQLMHVRPYNASVLGTPINDRVDETDYSGMLGKW